MKVLMLGWELPPHNSGGLGVACYNLCKALSKKDVSIEFIVPYTAEHDIDFMNVRGAYPYNAETVMSSGIAYDSYKYTTKDGTSGVASLYDLVHEYERVIDSVVEDTEFDIIHAHDWLTFRAGLRAKQLSGKPLILHVHALESDRAATNSGGNPLVREIESLSMMMADKVIAVSEWTKKCIMREYDIPADKIDVVHNSMDAGDMDALDIANSYEYLVRLKQQGYKILLNVGRLTVQKGLVNMLHAMKEVVAREPKTMLVLVGNGEQYTELIRLAADLGIGKNVLFTGFQRGKKWRDSFGVSDLFLMPSVSEPFGLTPLEAIGYGTPALVSNQSGVAEVLKNLLKVDFWDTHEMANQILAVVRSDEMKHELQANAYKEFSGLSWQKSADKMIAHYDAHTRLAVA